jgi:DHA1 family multidrug resistance protein-like MFS transporter
VPDSAAGSILGLSVSSQYVGQVAGPVLGGFVGGHIGMRAVFVGTSVLLIAGAAYSSLVRPRNAATADRK